MTYGYLNYGSGSGSFSGYSKGHGGSGHDAWGSKGGYGGSSGGHGGSSGGWGSSGGSSGGWGGSKDHGGSKGGSSWGSSSSWGDKDDCGWGGSKGGSGWGGSKGGSSWESCGAKGGYGGSKGGASWGGKDDHGWGGKGGCGPDETPEFEPGAEVAQCSFTLELDGVKVVVTVTQLENDALRFDVVVADDAARIGDLRGLFFNVDDGVEGDLAIYGDDVTESKFGHESVNDLGNGVNVKGTGAAYDVGVEFGSSGVGADDVRSTTFYLVNLDGALTLDDLADQGVAARLTSVGEEGGRREDSLKITGETGALDCGGFNNAAPPEPADDAAAVCAGDQVTIDLLANDLDPGETDFGAEENWGLTIAAVFTATGAQYFADLAPGEWITLDSGARVTLVDGELVYDSAGVWDDLLIGEHAVDTFEYAVFDSDGAPGFAEVSVTIGGALNLVETIGNDDPASAFVDLLGLPGGGGITGAFDFAGDLAGLGGGYTQIYCIDRDRPLNTAPTDVLVYSSLDADGLPTTSFDGGSFVDNPENLDLVNWILNQGYEGTYSYNDIQSAIWQLVDDRGGIDTLIFTPGIQLSAGAAAIVAAAQAEGEGFVPDADLGQTVGMIFQPVSGSEESGYVSNGQIFIAGFQLEDCDAHMLM
ncbi:thioester domain-containing protein [Albimonas pacifica]|uniref:Uncharacterized protein n=1 Tax=Albimonas pacifica TaxID=1114924 RepID=A0A1I3EKW5_9RHOB|nr:thioester domain-containing protein [Albimonas pacifica]SFH99626.1 hypothetical protein SAMN05216258_103445 [Albimonas pacifica]